MDTRRTKLWLTPLASAITLLLMTLPSYAVMQPLDDQSLGQETGQAAFYTSYIDAGGTNQGVTNPNAGIGFFTLGLNGTIQLNANIDHLQLGCGGVKGPGCDIDLSQVSLSGATPDANGSYASTDAVLTNPFIQLAIKNPTSLSTRELVGFNLGAQSILGMLSIGQNTNTAASIANGSASQNNNTGINSLTGYLGLNLVNTQLTNVQTCAGVTIFSTCVGVPITTTATVASYSQNLTLNRASSIADLGPITATALGGALNLSNVHVQNQLLAAVHNITLADSSGGAAKDVSLSLQNQNIYYPTSTGFSPAAATQGWFISLPQITLPNVVSNQEIDIPLGTVIGGVFGAPVNLQGLDYAQQHVANCYGGLKFC